MLNPKMAAEAKELMIYSSWKEAGLEEPDPKTYEDRRRIPARPIILEKTVSNTGAVTSTYRRLVKRGQMVYRPAIHMGKNKKLEDFDGAWIEVGAEYA